MARVGLLCPDLLFGSKVEGALLAAGHQVTRFDPAAYAPDADVLVVDLTDDAEQRIAAVATARGPTGPPVLAFYSHVEQDVRRSADEAGFELVVPRSRMAREGAGLVAQLAADA